MVNDKEGGNNMTTITPPKITMRAARINAGLSISEASKLIGVSDSTLRNWEDDSSSIKVSFLDKIESAYDYPINYIFFGKTLEFKSS